MRADVVGGALTDQTRRSPSQHAIEFVDQQIDRLVGIARCYRRREIRPCDFDPSLRRDHPLPMLGIRFNVDPYAENIVMVAEQPFGLRLQGRFHCVGQPEVYSA